MTAMYSAHGPPPSPLGPPAAGNRTMLASCGPPPAPGGCTMLHHGAMPCFCCPPPSLLGAQPLLSLHPAASPHHGGAPLLPASVFAVAQAAADTRRRWQQQVCAATTQQFSRKSRAAHAFDPDMTPGAASPTSHAGSGGTPAEPTALEQRQLLAALRCASAIAASGDAKECVRCSYIDHSWRVDAATGGCCAKAPPNAGPQNDPIFESLLKFDGLNQDDNHPAAPRGWPGDPRGGVATTATLGGGGIKEAPNASDEDGGVGGGAGGGSACGGDGEEELRRQQLRHENVVVGQLAALLVMTRKYNNQFCKSVLRRPDADPMSGAADGGAAGAEPCEWAAVQKCLFAHRPREVRRDPLDFFRRYGAVYSHAPCLAVLGGSPCNPTSCPYSHSAIEQEMHPLQLLRELNAAAAAERAAATKRGVDGNGNAKDEDTEVNEDEENDDDSEVVALLRPGPKDHDTADPRDGAATTFDDKHQRSPRVSVSTPPPPPPTTVHCRLAQIHGINFSFYADADDANADLIRMRVCGKAAKQRANVPRALYLAQGGRVARLSETSWQHQYDSRLLAEAIRLQQQHQQYQPPASQSSQLGSSSPTSNAAGSAPSALEASVRFDDILQEALFGGASTPPSTPSGVARSAAMLSPHAPVKGMPPTHTLVSRPPPTPCSIMDIGAALDCASPPTRAVRSLTNDFRLIEVAPPPPSPPMPMPMPIPRPMPMPMVMGSSEISSATGFCTSTLSADAAVFTPAPPNGTAATTPAATAAMTASTLGATSNDLTPATGLETIVRTAVADEATALLLPEFFGGPGPFGGAAADVFELGELQDEIEPDEEPGYDAAVGVEVLRMLDGKIDDHDERDALCKVQADAATMVFGAGEVDDEQSPSPPLRHLGRALGGREHTIACAKPDATPGKSTTWFSKGDGSGRCWWAMEILLGPYPEVAEEISFFNDVAPHVAGQLTDLLLADACN